MTNVMNQKQTVIVFALLGAALLAGCSHQDQTSNGDQTPNGPHIRAGVAPQDPQARAAALAALKALPASAQSDRAPQDPQARAAALAALQAQQPR